MSITVKWLFSNHRFFLVSLNYTFLLLFYFLIVVFI